MIKRLFALILTIVLALSIVSCEEKHKYAHCELILPLTSDYQRVENENFDVAYSNGKNMVAVLRISFVAGMNEGIPETMTTVEFRDFWLDKLDREAILADGEITYCEYYDGEAENETYYLEAFYRSKYAYFVVLFATNARREEDGRREFLSYTEKVKFK